MTAFLTAADVERLRVALGLAPVRDEGLLLGAIGRPTVTVFGVDAFPTMLDKAAALLHGIATGHPLVDGNKRLAWAACVTFCHINGVVLDGKDDEVVQFVIDVAAGIVADTEAVAAGLQRFIEPGYPLLRALQTREDEAGRRR